MTMAAAVHECLRELGSHVSRLPTLQAHVLLNTLFTTAVNAAPSITEKHSFDELLRLPAERLAWFGTLQNTEGYRVTGSLMFPILRAFRGVIERDAGRLGLVLPTDAKMRARVLRNIATNTRLLSKTLLLGRNNLGVAVWESLRVANHRGPRGEVVKSRNLNIDGLALKQGRGDILFVGLPGNRTISDLDVVVDGWFDSVRNHNSRFLKDGNLHQGCPLGLARDPSDPLSAAIGRFEAIATTIAERSALFGGNDELTQTTSEFLVPNGVAGLAETFAGFTRATPTFAGQGH